MVAFSWRALRSRSLWTPAPFLLIFLASAASAHAQLEFKSGGPVAKKAPVQVLPQRDLTFGDVIPGVDTTVNNSDPNSGYWQIQGDWGATVRLDFIGLPANLNGATDTMPVRYETTSAIVLTWALGWQTQQFDPASGTTIQLGWFGLAWVYLGGVASPRPNQSAGNYAAPVTLNADYSSGASL